MYWEELEPAFDSIIGNGFTPQLYQTYNHPCAAYINDARVPCVNGNSPAFFLHSLPDGENKGYVDQDVLQSIINTIEKKRWCMLVGKSG